jgi:hypothetical protein
MRNGVWQDYYKPSSHSTSTSYLMSAPTKRTTRTWPQPVALRSEHYHPHCAKQRDWAFVVRSFSIAGVNPRSILTVNADGSATIQADANGDGVFELFRLAPQLSSPCIAVTATASRVTFACAVTEPGHSRLHRKTRACEDAKLSRERV